MTIHILYDTLVLSVLEYGSIVWNLSKTNYFKNKKIWDYFAKVVSVFVFQCLLAKSAKIQYITFSAERLLNKAFFLKLLRIENSVFISDHLLQALTCLKTCDRVPYSCSLRPERHRLKMLFFHDIIFSAIANSSF